MSGILIKNVDNVIEETMVQLREENRIGLVPETPIRDFMVNPSIGSAQEKETER